MSGHKPWAEIRKEPATPTVDEQEVAKDLAGLIGLTHVVVCLGGIHAHENGSPIMSCKVYGPFTEDEVGEKARQIWRIEGSGVFVRPLVDLDDTFRRLSAD